MENTYYNEMGHKYRKNGFAFPPQWQMVVMTLGHIIYVFTLVLATLALAPSPTQKYVLLGVTGLIFLLLVIFHLCAAVPDAAKAPSTPSEGSSYCHKCDETVPATAKHCNYCNKCVPGYDHHCIWLGCCVGRRNYKSFLIFAHLDVIWSLYAALALAYLSLYTFVLDLPSHLPWVHPLGISAGAVVVAVVAVVEAATTVPLLFFHYKIQRKHMTTYEYLREKARHQRERAAAAAAEAEAGEGAEAGKGKGGRGQSERLGNMVLLCPCLPRACTECMSAAPPAPAPAPGAPVPATTFVAAPAAAQLPDAVHEDVPIGVYEVVPEFVVCASSTVPLTLSEDGEGGAGQGCKSSATFSENDAEMIPGAVL